MTNYIKKLLALAVAAGAMTTVAAPKPVAIWNGDFASLERNGFTINAHTDLGNSVGGMAISIGNESTSGISITHTDTWAGANGITVAIRYENFSAEEDTAIATFKLSGKNNCVGVRANGNGDSAGIYSGAPWANESNGHTKGVPIPASETVYMTYSDSTYTRLYKSDGTFLYDGIGLRESNKQIGDLITIGALDGGAMVAKGMTITGIAVFNTALSADDIREYTFPSAPQLMLLNFHQGTPVEGGWLNWTQSGDSAANANIPATGSDPLTMNGVTFSVAGSGKYLSTNGTPVESDFVEGTYTDVYGNNHETVMSEVKASLGVTEALIFDETVYKTGLVNGGQNSHTATLAGLRHKSKYVVYVGMGMKKGGQYMGFRADTAGYSSVEKLEYVTTVSNSDNNYRTTASPSYTEFSADQELRPGDQGLLLVRLVNVQPLANGQIKFMLAGERSGINFVAVHELPTEGDDDQETWADTNISADTPTKVFSSLKTLDKLKETIGWGAVSGRLGGASIPTPKSISAIVLDSEDATSVTYQLQLNDYNNDNDKHLKVCWVKFTAGTEADPGIFAVQTAQCYFNNKGPEYVGMKVDSSMPGYVGNTLAAYKTVELTVDYTRIPPTALRSADFNTGNQTVHASSIVGGSAFSFPSGGDWSSAPTYKSIRGSDTDKAVVISGTVKPYMTSIGLTSESDFSFMTVAKLSVTDSAPRVIAYLGDNVASGGSVGLTLVTVDNKVVLVNNKNGGEMAKLITADAIENASSQFHTYLVTYSAESRTVQLYVDGAAIAENPVAVVNEPGVDGLQLGAALGNSSHVTVDGVACDVGAGIELDEFAIWNSDVGEFAEAIAAHYPIWPLRAQIVINGNTTTSAIRDQIPAGMNGASIVVGADVTLTVDADLSGINFELTAEESHTLTIVLNESLRTAISALGDGEVLDIVHAIFGADATLENISLLIQNVPDGAVVITIDGILMAIKETVYSDEDVSFVTANGPTKAPTIENVAAGTGLSINTAYRRVVNSRLAEVFNIKSSATENGLLFGGFARGAEGDLYSDIWMNVLGGNYEAIVGGSNSDNWSGSPANRIFGNVTVEVGGNTVAKNVLGGFYKDGRGPSLTGDINVVIKDNAVVKGLIAGAGISAHNNTAAYTGNVSVLVKNVQSDNTAGVFFDNCADCSDYIVGGGVYGTNANSKENVTGNTGVIIDLPETATGTFVKNIVGGGFIAQGGNAHSNPECTVSGDASVTITAPDKVMFTGNIYAGGYAHGAGVVTVGGSATLTINGGDFSLATFNGGVATGGTSLTVNGGFIPVGALNGFDTITLGAATGFAFPEGHEKDVPVTITEGELSYNGATSGEITLTAVTVKVAEAEFYGATVVLDLTNKTAKYIINGSGELTRRPDFVGMTEADKKWTAPKSWMRNGELCDWEDGAANVVINASEVSEVVVDDVINVGIVTLTTDEGDSNRSFKFLTLEPLDEVADAKTNPRYVLNGKVIAGDFNGELYLQSRITKSITIGGDTQVVFVAMEKDEETTAYPYQFSGLTLPIRKIGPGDFIVPSSMYGYNFNVRGGNLIYDIAAGKEVSITGTLQKDPQQADAETHSLIKRGEGTLDYPANAAAAFLDGVVVREGTFKLTRAANNYPFWSGTPVNVAVENGGTLDLNGKDGFKADVTLGEGATLKNSGATIDTGSASLHGITLVGNATVDTGANDFGLLANNYTATIFNPGGYTLTKVGTGEFFICNATSSSTGTIHVKEGTFGPESGAANLAATDVIVDSGATLKVARDFTIGSLTLAPGATVNRTAALTIVESLTYVGEEGAVFNWADISAPEYHYPETPFTMNFTSSPATTVALPNQALVRVTPANLNSVLTYNLTGVDPANVTLYYNGHPCVATIESTTTGVVIYPGLRRKNPVTGEVINFTNAFRGETDATWEALGNWAKVTGEAVWTTYAAAKPPMTPSSAQWDPTLIDGKLIAAEGNREVTATTLEGWVPRLGLFNGVNLTINSFNKIQNGDGVTSYFMVDATSKLTIGSVTNSKADKASLYVAAPEGIEMTARFAPGNAIDYYFAGLGSVKYAAGSTGNGAHTVKRFDLVLDDHTTPRRYGVVTRKLISFTDDSTTAFTFADDCAVGLYDGADFPEATATAKSEGSLVGTEALGTYVTEVAADGVYVKYIGYSKDAVSAGHDITSETYLGSYEFVPGVNVVSVIGAENCDDAFTVHFDKAELPENVKFNVSGHVNFKVKTPVTQLPADRILLADDACLAVYAPFDAPFTIPQSAKVIVRYQGSNLNPQQITNNGTLQIDKDATFFNGLSGAANNVDVYGALKMVATRWEIGGVLTVHPGADISGLTSDEGAFDLKHGGLALAVEPGAAGSGTAAVINAKIRVRAAEAELHIAEGLTLEVKGGIGVGSNNEGKTLKRTGEGHLAGIVKLLGASLDYGTQVSGIPAQFVATGSTTSILRWTGKSGSEEAITALDSPEPFITVEKGSTLEIVGANYSGNLGDFLPRGRIENHGTLVMRDRDSLRYFRQPLVLGDGSTLRIDGTVAGGDALILYGGAAKTELAQINLPSGSATIEAGSGANARLAIGREGGTYGTPGAGISVGAGAKLTINAPMTVVDTLTKWGAGTLSIAANRVPVVIKEGVLELKLMTDEFLTGRLELPAPNAEEPTKTNYRLAYGSGQAVTEFEVEREGDNYVFTWQPELNSVLTDYVDITIKELGNLTDYPVLIRISEELIPGFTYERAGADGRTLRFYQAHTAEEYQLADNQRNIADDVELPFEIAEWNTSGTSLIWVKVNPAGSGIATEVANKLRMRWHVAPGKEIEFENMRPLPSERVWSAYAGVWHMDEAITPNNAARTVSKDSTANYLHAVPSYGHPLETTPSPDRRSEMISMPGVLGRARVNAKTQQNHGNYLEIPNYDQLELGGTFVFSAWLKLTENTNWPQIACRKSLTDKAVPGWQIESKGDDRKNVQVRGSGTGNISAQAFSGNPETMNEFTHIAVVYNGANVTIYANGVQKNSNSIGAAAEDNGLPLALGQGHFGELKQPDYPSLRGAFDEVRLMKLPQNSANWVSLDYKMIKGEASELFTYGMVNRPSDDGLGRVWVDYWTKEPALNHYWRVNDPPTTNGVNQSRGALKSGRAVEFFCRDTAAGEGIIELPTAPAKEGLYSIEYRGRGTTDANGVEYVYFDGTRQLEFEIIVEKSTSEIDPNGPTKSGRVLLVNNDPEKGVTDQGYDDEKWTHGSDIPPDLGLKLRPGLTHTLRDAESNTLWRIKDAYIGTLLKAREDGELELDEDFNTLPWSTNATENAQIIFRNSRDAMIESRLYPNGIGTVYFDVVNAVTNIPADELQLVVEVTDNEHIGDDGYNIEWTPVNVQAIRMTNVPLDRSTGRATMLAATNTVNCLNVQNGGNLENFTFYRVVAPVNMKKPCGFRIRRITQRVGNPTELDDINGFIVIDNVVASFAQQIPTLVTPGKYDETKKGATVLGQETAFTVDYPAAGESVKGRVVVADGEVSDLASVRLRYRWRYLNQTTDWKTSHFELSGDARELTTKDPLELPGLVGDVEYFYDLSATVPYYTYVDYATVTGVSAMPTGAYTEAPSLEKPLEVRAEDSLMPSRGRDWFVRLREWPSATRGWNLMTKTTNEPNAKVTITPMEYVDEHIWRGLVKTFDVDGESVKGDIYFHLTAEYPENAGTTNYTWTVKHFDTPDFTTMPYSLGYTETSEYSPWAKVPSDGITGYVMIQVDESLKVVSIMHADYQAFNTWHDAHTADGAFVTKSTDDVGKSGTARQTRAFSESFSTWTDTPATNVEWRESFNFGTGYEFNRSFSQARTPNGWTGYNGMWIAERFTSGGGAFQMEGQGHGMLEYNGQSVDPRGLESLNYNARLAESIEFSNISYYDANDKESMTNYTFVVNAAMSDEARTASDSKDNFDGAGQLSLFACYQPRVGAYEVRLTRTAVLGYRLAIYKWTEDAYGNITARQLGGERAITASNVQNAPFWKWDASPVQYSQLFISVEKVITNNVDTVRIQAGISTTRAADGDDVISSGYHIQSFWDNDHPFTGGTYGIASANCEAVFTSPRTLPVASTYVSKKAPGQGDGANNWRDVIMPQRNPISERDHILANKWAIDKTRLNAFADVEKQKNRWGLKAKIAPQKLVIEYKGLTTGAEWVAIATNTVESYTLGHTIENVFNRTASGLYRIRHLKTNSANTEIVIDNVELKQWGGSNYGDSETLGFVEGEARTSYPESFVFTSGWISNGAVELSAKRTQPGTPCSIRSPLMDGYNGRGTGLGMISFAYQNAQENVNLLVQIATNNVSGSARDQTMSLSDGIWTTVTNFNFAAISPEERKGGVMSAFLGLHEVSGLMRIVMDTNVVAAVQSETDPNKFGSITISNVFCRDEPKLDKTSWWGWNIRTVGQDGATNWDDGRRAYLPDFGPEAGDVGLSLALNDSVINDTRAEDGDTYREHIPFVQTPTLDVDTIGQISFRARMFSLNASDAKGRVTIYGNREGDGDPTTSEGRWHQLAVIEITNTVYETYTYRAADELSKYRAFRLAVTGVPSALTDELNPEPSHYGAVRVLIDEVIVCESVSPKMGFKYVYPVRSGLTDNTLAPALDEEGRANFNEQPLLGENWTIQAEIQAKQLPQEIDLQNPEHAPRVYFHWYMSDDYWGYENWSNKCHTAELKLAEGETMVYRGSLTEAPNAVVDESEGLSVVVQYAASVVYWDTKNVEHTHVIDQGEWIKPYWYDPIDFNARNGAFTPYTILESIAPRRAWINEVNVADGGHDNEMKNQYVEIALPAGQSLEGWRLEYIDDERGTNTLCTFGTSARQIKCVKLEPAVNDYAFLVIQSPETAKGSVWDGVKMPNGQPVEFDGTWNSNIPSLFIDYPVGLRLVRPSGVIEHAIIFEGKDIYAGGAYADVFSVDAIVKEYNAESAVTYIAAGEETDNDAVVGLAGRSLGVFEGYGASSNEWTNAMTQTPGWCNSAQTIPEGWVVEANGSMIVITAKLVGGHVTQLDGEGAETASTVRLTTPKGGEGAELVYFVDTWYDLKSVIANEAALALPGGVRQADGRVKFVIPGVGAGLSNNVSVVATTAINDELTTKYGIDEKNRYTAAIMAWLEQGKTLRGEFKNPGEIHLAEYFNLNGEKVSDLSLTEMYWLDMDPTEEGWSLNAGVTEVKPVAKPEGLSNLKLARLGPTDPDQPAVTSDNQNLRIKVKMTIHNADESISYAPYVIRGAEPGELSSEHNESTDGNWASANFKITGDIQNGMPQRQRWVPLRMFYFTPDFDKANLSASFDENNESTIDVWDPFDQSRVGLKLDWDNWPKCPVFYSWSISDETMPVSIVPLTEESTYE